MNDLREALAAEAHRAWSEWMRYMFRKGQFERHHIGHTVESWTMPEWAIKRWQRQMNTPYDELPEDEKESDRKEADRYMLIMEAYMSELVREAVDKEVESTKLIFERQFEKSDKARDADGGELAHAARVVADLESKMLPAAKINGALLAACESAVTILDEIVAYEDEPLDDVGYYAQAIDAIYELRAAIAKAHGDDDIDDLRETVEAYSSEIDSLNAEVNRLRDACESALDHVTDALLYPDEDPLVVELRAVLGY